MRRSATDDSGRRLDERYPVAVGIANDEIASAPRLFLQLLHDGYARSEILRIERLHVLDFDERDNESVSVVRARCMCWFVHELEMKTGAIARYRGVERRFPMQEVDRK